MRNNLSSPNFFILLTPFTPIQRFFTHSTLLGGILPCEIRSFWHPGSFQNFSGTEVRAVFVRRIFQNKSHFSTPPTWLRLPTVIFVFVCVCIFVFVYFLSFCVYFVYSYSYLRRICVFPAFSAARSPLLLTSRHLPVNAGDDR